MKNLLILLLIFTINGYCDEKFEQLYQADLPRKAMEISYYGSGKIKELVLSQWTDRIKTDEGNIYHTYKQGYSYAKQQGFIKVYNMQGKLIEEKWDKTIDGGISQEEALLAYEVFKKDPKVKNTLASTENKLNLYTGFNFLDESACSYGNRCVHVFAELPNSSKLAHAIIRLTDLSVPYPEYDLEKSNVQK